MAGDRLIGLAPFEALKLSAGINLLSPNLPLLFMGEEYGEKAPFQYFVDHSDRELIEAVRRGRREEFAAFQWEGEAPDPRDEATFLRSKIDLGLRHQGNHRALFDLYKMLIKLRKEVPSLSVLTRKGMEARLFEGTKAIRVKREHGGDRVVCFFNFDSRPVNVSPSLGDGLWQRILESASERWGGPGGTGWPEFIRSGGPETSFNLGAYGFVLYRQAGPNKGLAERSGVS